MKILNHIRKLPKGIFVYILGSRNYCRLYIFQKFLCFPQNNQYQIGQFLEVFKNLISNRRFRKLCSGTTNTLFLPNQHVENCTTEFFGEFLSKFSKTLIFQKFLAQEPESPGREPYSKIFWPIFRQVFQTQNFSKLLPS